MRGKRAGTYRNELRRTFLVYALVPMICLSLAVYGGLVATWSAMLTRQNIEGGERIATRLSEIINTYDEALAGICADGRLDPVLDGQKPGTDLYEAFYAISNATGIRCQFHVIDLAASVLLSSEATVPWYAGSENRMHLGILRLVQQQPNRLSLEIAKQRDDATTLPPLLLARGIVRNGSLRGIVTLDLKYQDLMVLANASPSLDVVLTDAYRNVGIITNPIYQDERGKMLPALDRDDGRMRLTGSDTFVLRREIPGRGIWLYTILHVGVPQTVFQAVGLFLVLLFLVLALVLGASARNISGRKAEGIEAIVRGIRAVQAGDLATTLDIRGGDEFSLIGEAFNGMLGDIRRLMDLHAEEARQKAAAEVRQLESQFNPHFLFNTLETIKYMISLDPKAALKMITSLSALLRYSIGNHRAAVPLSEDLSYTQNYLLIQKYRFGERFEYDVALDPETADCLVPKLVIQPFIENALKYGFGARTVLTVRIRASLLDGSLVVVIYDDGPGMEPRQLDEIRRMLGEEHNETEHIGLYNVHRRIRLMYGEPYGLVVQSEPGSGTVIRIVMPAGRTGDAEHAG